LQCKPATKSNLRLVLGAKARCRGWNYALNWLVTLPLELTAASITLSFWPGARDVNPAAWVVIFWLAVVLINFFGVRGWVISKALCAWQVN
jgi:amino acid permease